MNDRDCAISHGIQLVEATGLKAGGHEEDVTACSDAMGHAHTEAHPTPTLVLPMLFHFPASPARNRYHWLAGRAHGLGL